MIIITDASLPIEVGDRIKRVLPSGVEEVFVVTDPGFQNKVFDTEAHYQAKVKREESVGHGHDPRPDRVTYNVSGPNARVNIGSIDQSTNVVGSAEVGPTFNHLRDLLREHVSDLEEQDRLIAKADELENAHHRGTFTDSYKQFMAMAAHHMAVLAPILPALSSLL